MVKQTQHEKDAIRICQKSPLNLVKEVARLLTRIGFLENKEKDKAYLKKLLACRALFFNILRQNRNSYKVSEWSQEGLSEISEIIE